MQAGMWTPSLAYSISLNTLAPSPCQSVRPATRSNTLCSSHLSLHQKIPSDAGIGNPFQCENSTLN